jgi:DNA-binding Lrp family transcriptional regulator
MSSAGDFELVDDRDFWILSQLRRDPFSSYETLGRGIGLSGNAAKSRLEALQKRGILTSLNAMPAAQVFHRFPRLFFFKQPVTSMDEFNAALEIDSAVFATLDVDDSVAVLVYDLPSASSPIPPEELTTLLGAVDSEATPLFPYPRRELSKPVSLAELKVLRMLVANLRVPLKEVSQSTGLSQKVAKKARRRLMDDGLLQVQPIFQSAHSSRILMYEVHVHSKDSSVLSRLKQTLPKSVFINQWESNTIVFSRWADSIAEVFESERRLRSEPGVDGVRVKFHTRAILASSRLTSWIDGEIRRLERGK